MWLTHCKQGSYELRTTWWGITPDWHDSVWEQTRVEGKKKPPGWAVVIGVIEVELLLFLGGGLFGFLLLALQVVDAAAAFFDFVMLLSHTVFSKLSFRFSTEMAGNMKIWRGLFNIILVMAAAGFTSGCKTSLKKRLKKEEISTLECYLETHKGLGPRSKEVSIGRTNPVRFLIEAGPVVQQHNVLKAELWDTKDGGIAIRCELDRWGRASLRNVSLLHRGKRLAVHSNFPEGRWLDAIPIESSMADGVLIIYPDASEEEAKRIVSGLNKLAEALEEDRDADDL